MTEALSLRQRPAKRRRPVESKHRIHDVLAKALERRQKSYLWTPAHSVIFVPRLMPKVYGDGRALITFSTLNQRPAYWVVRVGSDWDCDYNPFALSTPTTPIREMSDEILTDLEAAFGNGRCGFCGNSLFEKRSDRLENCQCEDCSSPGVAKWPMVDGQGGCCWSRMRWPAGFATEQGRWLLAKGK